MKQCGVLPEKAATVRNIIARRSWLNQDFAAIQEWIRNKSRKQSTFSLTRYHPYKNAKAFVAWQAKRYCHVYMTLAKNASYSQHLMVSDFEAPTKDVHVLRLWSLLGEMLWPRYTILAVVVALWTSGLGTMVLNLIQNHFSGVWALVSCCRQSSSCCRYMT